MKRLFKKILSVLLAMLLTCSLVLPALTENAEGVICNDCADSIGLTENNACPDCDIAHEHLEEQENIGLMPDDEIDPSINGDSQLQQMPLIEEPALIDYNTLDLFWQTVSKAEISADGKTVTANNVNTTFPHTIEMAYVAGNFLYYLAHGTIGRLDLATNERLTLTVSEYAKTIYPMSQTEIQVTVPQNPEHHSLTIEELHAIEFYPGVSLFTHYIYNVIIGDYRELTEQEVMDLQALELGGTVIEPGGASIQATTQPSNRLPFADYPTGSYFTNDGDPCPNHNNCLWFLTEVYDPGTYAPQCQGFAYFVMEQLAITYNIDCETQAFYRTAPTLSPTFGWEELLRVMPANSQVRIVGGGTNSQHYFIYLNYTEASDGSIESIQVYDCNGTGVNCQVAVRTVPMSRVNGYTFSWYSSLEIHHDYYGTENETGHYCVFPNCNIHSSTPHTYGGSFYPSGAAGHYQKCTVCGHAGPPTSHSYTQFANITNTNHSLKCGVCSYIHSPNPHASVSYTSQSEYEHVVSCNACGLNIKPHVNETAYNSSVHFDKCSLCNYANVLTEEPHSLSYEITGTTHKGSCSGCSYTTANNNHTFSNWAPNGSTHHRKVCSLCGRAVTAAHTFGGWTSSTESRHFRYCSGCSYPNYANHNFSSWTDYSGTQHEGQCSDCDYLGYSDHAYGSWVTHTNTAHKRTCTSCTRMQTASHSFSNWGSISATQHRCICIICGQQRVAAHSYTTWGNYSNTQHRRHCAACSRYEYGNHTGNWGTYTATLHQRNCSLCGKHQTASHTFGTWSSISSTQHRRTCYACSYPETASHTITIQQIVGNTTHHRTNCNTCGYTALKAHSFNSAGICTKCKLNINFTPVLNLPSEPISS